MVGTSDKTLGRLVRDMGSNPAKVGTARFILSFSGMYLNTEHSNETEVFGLRISPKGPGYLSGHDLLIWFELDC